jgi:hypothetical protein
VLGSNKNRKQPVEKFHLQVQNPALMTSCE